MAFTKEEDFESALIEQLTTSYGWEKDVLSFRTEAELIQNWAGILYSNNRSLDRLDNYPLTKGEMGQIIEQITNLRTPLKLNGFINGKTVSITRDNADDKLHFGKEVSLKIYDRMEIAAGQSRYQIARQPKFKASSKMLNDRRGDIMLLINGMPVFHIELKRSGVPISQACSQIEKYAHEGVYSGLFSLVQIFVAMNPEETVYFANPGPDGKFDRAYYFHWADFNNEPINGWKEIASTLLSIPMAHQLIGFYTVADNTDGILKVMRSYQYYAANAISDVVAKARWGDANQRGGHIWHTTGSGKTMTSFKSAQLIADSKDADKVVFLIDRIELGTQSLNEYRGFADESESVQGTENTGVLVTKLKSAAPADTLIVTSIQKMSNIRDDAEGGLKAADVRQMQSKRIVFIIDECHRSTFGDMMERIKDTFPDAIFFGFSGTPILSENQKKMSTTADVFGNELHRYSIADGIRDKNVLGFDPYMVSTFDTKDVRMAVALEKAKASSIEEAMADRAKKAVFDEYMDSSKVKMAGHEEPDGKYVNGIEDCLPDSQYNGNEKHHDAVADDIIKGWKTLSRAGKFHAIFATESISEAIQYYRLFKCEGAKLKVTALFDPNVDNVGDNVYKEDGLAEIIGDYNARYGQNFTIPTFGRMKKDIAARLAHKRPYERLETSPEKEIDLLIVVNQMLTGFDSKWVNTLYLDKVLWNENVIQAFSRTNRLFGPDKPFGTIRYYRRPYTMRRNIEEAFELYSGGVPAGLFVQKLEENLNRVNSIYAELRLLFGNAQVLDFDRLPASTADRGKFAKLFRELNIYLEAAKIQGFRWEKNNYVFPREAGHPRTTVLVDIDEQTYKTLTQRYKELFDSFVPGPGVPEPPYDLDGNLTEISTGAIDADYMESNFKKYLKVLKQDGTSVELEAVKQELHKTFAMLSQDDQKYANIFLHAVQSGDAAIEEGKTLRDYIAEYQCRARDAAVNEIVADLGVDKLKLMSLLSATRAAEASINEYGRFDDLKSTIDKAKARAYFEKLENKSLPQFKANMMAEKMLKDFLNKYGAGK